MSPANKYSNLFIIQRVPIAHGNKRARHSKKLALRRSVYVKISRCHFVQELVLIASQSHELRLVGFTTVLLCQKKRLIASNLSIRSLTIYWRQRPITTLADSARLIWHTESRVLSRRYASPFYRLPTNGIRNWRRASLAGCRTPLEE